VEVEAADCGPSPISHLALIYMEPATKGDAVNYCGNCREDGFVMGFQARVVEIPLDDGLLKDAWPGQGRSSNYPTHPTALQHAKTAFSSSTWPKCFGLE
jgi:hypothetical protein